MASYVTDALWQEYYKGKPILDYLQDAVMSEYLSHRGVDESIRNWMQSDMYEVECRLFREIADSVSPLIEKGIMEPENLDVDFWGSIYDTVEVCLEIELEDSDLMPSVRGTYEDIVPKVRELVKSIINNK